MQIGKITQVMGPVVDVHFDETPLPYIQTALQVDNHGKKVVMEVMQHIGTDTVRCIMLSPRYCGKYQSCEEGESRRFSYP